MAGVQRLVDGKVVNEDQNQVIPAPVKPWEQGFIHTEANKKPWDEDFPHKTEAETGLTQHAARIPVTEEMHPGFTNEDRAVYTLSNDPDAAVDYYRTKHPDMSIGLLGDRVVGKKTGETDWRPLSPKFDFAQSSDEYKRQLIDAGPGLAKGAIVTAGTVAGPETLGASALLAAALGGASENARQQSGKIAGINKEIKMAPIAFDAASNGLMPLLFGNGSQAGRGVLARGYDKLTQEVAPSVWEYFSGMPKADVQTIANRGPEVKALIQGGMREPAEQARETLTNTLQRTRTAIWNKMNDKLSQAGVQVDIAAARKPFDDALENAEKMYAEMPNTDNLKRIQKIQGVIKNKFEIAEPSESDKLKSYLTGQPLGPPNMNSASPKTAFALKQDMAELGEAAGARGQPKSNLTDMAPGDREIAIAARDSKGILDNNIGMSVDTADHTLGNKSESMSSLRQQYADEARLTEYLNSKFKDRDTTINTLNSLGSVKNRNSLAFDLKDLDSRNPDLQLLDKAKLFSAANRISNAGYIPQSSKGNPSTFRSGQAGILGLMGGYKIGSLLEHATGVPFLGQIGGAVGGMSGNALASPAMLQNYLRAGAVPRAMGETMGKYGLNLGVPTAAMNVATPPNMDFNQLVNGAPNAWLGMKQKLSDQINNP